MKPASRALASLVLVHSATPEPRVRGARVTVNPNEYILTRIT
jgi:hypothetical protein